MTDFLGACGLDSTTLADPKSKLDKVQEYLEARMPDASVLVGRMPVAQDWEPGVITLTPACWASVVRRAEKSADLIHQDTRAIELALVEFEDSLRTLSAAHEAGKTDPTKKPAAEAVTAGRERLAAVEAALIKYRPTRMASGSPIRHEQMFDVVGKFSAQVKDARGLLEAMKP